VWLELEDQALVLLALALGECSARCLLEHFPNGLATSGGALDVSVSVDLASNSLALLLSDGLLVDPSKLFDGLGVHSEILLAPNKNDGQARTEVKDFSNPLLLDVV